MNEPYTPSDNWVALKWTTAMFNAHLAGDFEEQKLLMQNIDRQAAPGIIMIILPAFLEAMHNATENPSDWPESDQQGSDDRE